MIANQNFNSVDAIMETFPDEPTCIRHLEDLRWDGIVTSPFDPLSKVYNCNGGRYRCRNTGKYFNARTGTIFSNSRIALQKWFIAVWIVSTQPRITSTNLSAALNLSQKTAWYMLKRIKRYLDTKSHEAPLLKLQEHRVLRTEQIETGGAKDKLDMLEWLKLLKK